MKRYINSSDNGDLRKLGITSDDFATIKAWCDNYDPDSEIGFEYKGSWITNPFIDTSGRFDLSIAEAIKTYGLNNVKSFCQAVLSNKKSILSNSSKIPREYGIFLLIENSLEPMDETDVIATFRGYQGPEDTSFDYNELCKVLVDKYRSKCEKMRNRVGYTCEVAAIAPYYEDGHPSYGSEYGNLLAYLDYEGNLIEEFPGGSFDDSYFDDDM